MLEGLISDVFIKIIAVVIGLATGIVQFFLLYKFVTSVTGGKMGTKTLIFAITQFLFPFAVLVICAFIFPNSLLWAGIGVAASLITCAVIKFIKVSRQNMSKQNMSKQNMSGQKEISKKKKRK